MCTHRNLICLVFIFPFGCGGQVLESNSGTGGNLNTGVTAMPDIGAGGTHPTNGGATTVLSTSPGGRLGIGGVSPMGGWASTAGASPNGCAPATATVANNCAVAFSATGSFTIANGTYFKLNNFAGYGFVYISPTSNPADSITCPNTDFGPSTSALCGAGIVPADCAYNAVGGIGFNLNQSMAGETGSALPSNSPAKVSTVVVTFANAANTDLHIQIVQNTTGSDAGGTYYCYEAKGAISPLVLNASDFNTTCWTTGGTPWDGTGAQSFQFVIPSQATSPTKFDACIENVVFS